MIRVVSPDAQLLLVAVLLGLIPAFIARRKGHTFMGFWLMGTMFFIVALPWAIFAPRNPRVFRRCPHCQEWVSAQATACPRCTRDLLPAAVGTRDRMEASAASGPEGRLAVVLWVLVGIVAVITIAVSMAVA